ncbi:zf-HC2 domain-containing protein [Xylanimonas ulmi]|uniref:Putative zinc finger protein n=1 Tax=Xylanimonas ulmi TaxID=228973 RepID=A0A4Q7M2D9_9MICO|nr:zf-HC2 domain-containing protein [Xylanibacterium ulmi]RZS62046.1 putative zinc finger protein [Xylanibacterium ulmi]
MNEHRTIDQAALLAALVGLPGQQRAWLGGASGSEHELDGADGAATELFCRVMARAAATQGCREVRLGALAYVDGSLNRNLRDAVSAHLRTCAECAWTIDRLPEVADAIGAVASVYAAEIVGPPESPATTLKSRVTSVPDRAARPARTRVGHRALAGVAAVLVIAAGGATAVALGGGRAPAEPAPSPTAPVERTQNAVTTRPAPSTTPSPSDDPSPSDSAEPDATSDAPTTPPPGVQPGGLARPGVGTLGGGAQQGGTGVVQPGPTTPDQPGPTGQNPPPNPPGTGQPTTPPPTTGTTPPATTDPATPPPATTDPTTPPTTEPTTPPPGETTPPDAGETPPSGGEDEPTPSEYGSDAP